MANDGLLLIYFVSFVIQTALQGILFCTSTLFVYVMLCRRSRSPLVLDVGLVGAALISGGAISYWSVSFAQLYNAIFQPGNRSPSVYLSDLHNPLFLTKIYLLFTFAAIADLLFIYRLYVVWQDRRCVVLPPLLVVASAFSIAISAITWLAQAADNRNIYDIAYSPRVNVAGILTISLNMYCTILISWRIWKAGRCAVRYGGPSLSVCVRIAPDPSAPNDTTMQQSFIIFIESAGLYLCGLLPPLFLLTYSHSIPPMLFVVITLVIYLSGSPVLFL
ncbi:hypothetical protein K523DRAFT_355414 [Schizophyllum commune Tattone D]|nr:hypothetical protein K523DRAFT_355414 [Schizophyllum commune Tattone D]